MLRFQWQRLWGKGITSVLSDEIADKIKPPGADLIINSITQDVAGIETKAMLRPLLTKGLHLVELAAGYGKAVARI